MSSRVKIPATRLDIVRAVSSFISRRNGAFEETIANNEPVPSMSLKKCTHFLPQAMGNVIGFQGHCRIS